MTIEQLLTLEQTIDEALNLNKSAGVVDVVRWIITNRRTVCEDNTLTLWGEGLEAMVRSRRKKRPAATEFQASKNLCLDFGLPVMELDTEISIPDDLEQNGPFGRCKWIEPDDATLLDIDKHITLLVAQGQYAFNSATSWRTVRQAAARFAHGDLNTPISILRQRAIASRL